MDSISHNTITLLTNERGIFLKNETKDEFEQLGFEGLRIYVILRI